MSRVDDRTERYLRAWTDIANLYFRGLLEQAGVVADDMATSFPERQSSVGYLRACLLCLLGRQGEALDAMQGVVDRGGWWTDSDLSDPDLDAIRPTPRFAALETEMRARAGRSAAVGRTSRVLFADPVGRPRALLIVLHMHGVSAPQTFPHWAPATDLGLAVAVLGSSQLEGDGLPCWDDPATADRDIAAAYDQARDRIDGDVPLVFAGGSQGAGVALRLAITGAFPDCPGFVAVSGGSRDDVTDDDVRAAAERGVRGVLIPGGDDLFFSQRALQVTEELVALGLEVRCEEAPGVPHAYPADLRDRLARAVAFILRED